MPAFAVEVTLIGLFPNKAVVQIDGGATRTLSVGQKTAEGIVLLSVERGAATFDIQGRRRTVKIGQQHATTLSSSAQSVTLAADRGGHFFAEALINGAPLRAIVDTGATVVTLSAADAARIGLEYARGEPVTIRTANGETRGFRVRLDSVRLGGISVSNVDAVVMERQAMAVLLGMSFLNSLEMKREGPVMTLTKRY